ncbi:MAG: MFS transporter [Tenericutes bacterium]|jgi:MFS family permease|nr:MFS transporter [Mycoplasmatota bacterium]
MSSINQHKGQMLKFGMYGFLKNLRFFEPFLILFFLEVGGLNLFQIGILISIREIIIYIVEIPSGVIADMYGKKTQLVMCFVFYIASFVIFFFGGIAPTFWIFVIAMGLFGFGEAFRSGTHKAMIMQFLDVEEIEEPKSEVYGKTRSMSLIGSTIMSLISVVLILWLQGEYHYLFLVAIIPYSIDLLMILTYPKYMNKRKENEFKLKNFLKENWLSLKYVFQKKKVRGFVVDASAFQAGFKSVKDYIQPLVVSASVGFILFSQLDTEENEKVYIGVIYAIIYIISAIATRNAYKLEGKVDKVKTINLAWLLMGGVSLLLGFFTNSIVVIFVAFILMYIILNLRRPIMVQEIGDVTEEGRRASALSIQAQLTSLLLVIFAPLIGLLADYSLQLLFMIVGAVMIAIYSITALTRRNMNQKA